ncbi:ROK family protein [Isoptericola sp. NPDC057191]|uniref:ROK family protein n=1 Tax=Isoptericola sp. NPDC057191 TaxID=3346041 RepID=UPI00363B3232
MTGAPASPDPGSLVVALDVGGTDVKAVLASRDGVLERRTVPTRADGGPDAAVRSVLDVVADLRAVAPAGGEVVAVGLAVPGAVDDERGLVVQAENLGWADLPVRDLVAEATGLPVGFGHDVRAGALAEWRYGAARGAADHAYLSVGTGIAAALVLRGEPYVGGGYAGEVGHGGPQGGAPCPCGGRGCPETDASAAGIARHYRERTGAAAADVRGSAEVLRRARSGDDVARQVWDHGVERLGGLVADLVRVLALPLVVVGGGIVRAGDDLFDPLRAAVARHLTYHPVPRVVPALLGADAGVRGAELLAWDAVPQGRP